jgi:hypothetical protein
MWCTYQNPIYLHCNGDTIMSIFGMIDFMWADLGISAIMNSCHVSSREIKISRDCLYHWRTIRWSCNNTLDVFAYFKASTRTPASEQYLWPRNWQTFCQVMALSRAKLFAGRNLFLVFVLKNPQNPHLARTSMYCNQTNHEHTEPYPKYTWDSPWIQRDTL